MEVARARLRSNAQSVVSGSEFAALCVDIAGGAEGGRRLARALDDSGVVIVLGDAVFLRPDMVRTSFVTHSRNTNTQSMIEHLQITSHTNVSPLSCR